MRRSLLENIQNRTDRALQSGDLVCLVETEGFGPTVGEVRRYQSDRIIRLIKRENSLFGSTPVNASYRALALQTLGSILERTEVIL